RVYPSLVSDVFRHLLSYAFVTLFSCFFFFNDTATTEIYTLSLHDALPISSGATLMEGSSPQASVKGRTVTVKGPFASGETFVQRSEEHTSELQSLTNLVCRLLLEKKKNNEMIQQPSPVITSVYREDTTVDY